MAVEAAKRRSGYSINAHIIASARTGALACTGARTCTTPEPASNWKVGSIYFAVGSGATMDLSSTLPAGVAKGGTFGVSATGAPLPSGMSLSSSGILANGNATVGEVVCAVFTYAVPGT